MALDDIFRDELESIYEISVEIASLHDLTAIYDRALDACLSLTNSQMGFIDLIKSGEVDMEVVAVKGFEPDDPQFFERFQVMPIRPSVFGVTIIENRPHISNDVDHDPFRVGTPPGHPHIRTFLGVPLRVGDKVTGMIGVANRDGGYDAEQVRLLSTFANQVAVAIDNARLYEHQREMIHRLQLLNQRISTAEREQLLQLERRRIASGLHDRIEQHIFTIGLQLSDLLEDGVSPEVKERLQRLRTLTSATAEEVREVIFALAVPNLDDSGLTPALRRLLRQTQQVSGIETDLVVTGDPPAGIGNVQSVIYEVVREALTNVMKHARARVVLVNIRYEPDRVDVVVQDDGEGASDMVLQTDRASQLHYGLRNMRRQIEGLGGSFIAENGEESGFTVRFNVPVDTTESSPESPMLAKVLAAAEDR